MTYDATPVAEIVRILVDRQWHDILDANRRYRLSPIEIYRSLLFLMSKGLVEMSAARVRLNPNLDETGASVLNMLLKTSRPSALDVFDWKLLRVDSDGVELKDEAPWH